MKDRIFARLAIGLAIMLVVFLIPCSGRVLPLARNFPVGAYLLSASVSSFAPYR